MDNNHDCIKLYEMAIDEEHYFSASYDNRIAFFLKIISTLIGVTVVGFYKATSLSHYLFLSVGPITIAVTSNLAKESIKRTYQRFLEAVTVRAKLELDLGLTDERGNKNSKYWANEPYIFTRHIQSREDTNTSNY